MTAVAVCKLGETENGAPSRPPEITAQDFDRRRVKVANCKNILERPDLSDEDAQGIIDHLYSFAGVVVDVFIELVCKQNQKTSPSPLEREPTSSIVRATELEADSSEAQNLVGGAIRQYSGLQV